MGNFSDFLDCNVGLLQGEISSPILFSLFVNDVELFLQNEKNTGLTIDQLNIYLLLFADDSVLISETADGLQTLLNRFELYCKKWELTVNTDKTKIMIFQNGGKIANEATFTYSNTRIETVRSFNHLGVVFTSSGSFINTVQTYAGKALRAMNALLSITRGKDIPIKIMLSLFDSFISPILTFSSEVWGFTRTEIAERVHRKFLKLILNLKQSTSNSAIYGELGRFPLSINVKIKIVKYFLNHYRTKSNNCILFTDFDKVQRENADRISKLKWASKVKDLLERCGFHDIWLFPASVNLEIFLPISKRRLMDFFVNDWHTDIQNKTSLTLFRILKSEIEISNYLIKIYNSSYRNLQK